MHRWLSILMVAVGAFGISACSGGGNGNPFNGDGGVDPLECEDFATPPPGCDEPCPSGDLDCQDGTFCFNGVCSAQCTAEEGCGEGFECNSRGRCGLILGGTGGTGGTGTCNPPPVTTSRIIPNVMFLVDQSGSMTEDFGGGQNRWEAAHSAITSVVSELDSIVRFGLTTYQSADGGSVPDECPIFDTQVSIALNNFSAINMSFPASFPGGEDTPTGESITELVKDLDAANLPTDGPTIIVLATDGEPDTCAVPDPQNGQAESVTAATAAHAAGYDIFVLSVGDDVGQAHLQDMANVGTGLAEDGSEGDATFWVATDPDSLEAAFNEIIGANISCEVKFDKAIANRQRACDEGEITLDGVLLDCPTEWNLQDGSNDTIVLLGAACDAWKAGGVTLTAEFPCGVVVE